MTQFVPPCNITAAEGTMYSKPQAWPEISSGAWLEVTAVDVYLRLDIPCWVGDVNVNGSPESNE